MMQKLDMQGSNELMFGAELLDGRVLQGLQDRFCACNNLYCVCLSQMQGVVTKAYGSKEELNYIHEKVGMAPVYSGQFPSESFLTHQKLPACVLQSLLPGCQFPASVQDNAPAVLFFLSGHFLTAPNVLLSCHLSSVQP